MAGPTTEVINGVLFVTGSLDRTADQHWVQALSQYNKASGAGERVIDMSNVRWLAPTGAKALISVAQEAGDKGAKVRVLASRHVMQTLNLLGAKSWLTIESCAVPTVKPGAPEPAVVAPAPAEAAQTPPETPALVLSESQTETAPGEAEKAAAASGKSASSMRLAAVTASLAPLAGPGEELSRGACLFRILVPNRRYSFNMASGENVMGIVRERVGGPWVLLETHGTRKVINLDNVEYCDIL